MRGVAVSYNTLQVFERFAGKVIAITGYEQDQVLVFPTGEPGADPGGLEESRPAGHRARARRGERAAAPCP